MNHRMEIQFNNRSNFQRTSDLENTRSENTTASGPNRSSDSNSSNNDTVIISEEAIAQFNQTKINDINLFLENNAQNIFKSVLEDSREFPENLASRLDRDSRISSEERSEITNQLSEREFEAFGKYAKQSPPDLASYYGSYINYLDSLSPEERSSERYSGQRALAVSAYERIVSTNDEDAPDLSEPDDFILTLLEIIENSADDLELRNEQLSEFRNNIDNTSVESSQVNTRAEAALEAVSLVELVQSIIEQAQGGDDNSYIQLQKLADNEISIDEFLSSYQIPR